MWSLGNGETNDAMNPVMVFIAGDEHGRMRDLAGLEVEVYDVSDETKMGAPVQVQARDAVDITLGGGNRLDRGRYVIPFTAPIAPAKGMHRMRLFWRFSSSEPWSSCWKELEVVPARGAFLTGPAYAFLADLRAEGVPSTGNDAVSDMRLQTAIVKASRYVERVTSRFFEARYMKPRFSAPGSRGLLINDPIVAVDYVAIANSDIDISAEDDVDPETIRVFNRHLSQQLTNPDDRDAPKIEFFHAAYDLYGGQHDYYGGLSFRALGFPRGSQNIEVAGCFGYTDPDGSPWGATPAMIRHATMQITLREMYLMTHLDCREDFSRRARLLSETTRDQSYTLAAPRAYSAGAFAGTGDPDIDSILVSYTRPPNLGAA